MALANTTINDNIGNIDTEFEYNGVGVATDSGIDITPEAGNGGDINRGGIPDNISTNRDAEIFTSTTPEGSITPSAEINQRDVANDFITTYKNHATLGR